MLICWFYLKFQIDYLNFLEEVEYTWLGANIIILYEDKKESSRCKMSFSLPKLVFFSQMHLPDFWKFQTDCLNPVEEVIIKHFILHLPYLEKIHGSKKPTFSQTLCFSFPPKRKQSMCLYYL